MLRLILFIVTLQFLNSSTVHAQKIDVLRDKINQIIEDKDAKVGVAIQGQNSKAVLIINNEGHFPMHNILHIHVALFMLSEIDKGKFSMDQQVIIEKSGPLAGLLSPLRHKYPDGAIITISELLEFTVSRSDFVGCEMLLQMLGGSEEVENYFIELGIKDLSIKIAEKDSPFDWHAQYKNWTTPLAANQVLNAFYSNKNNLLSQETYDFFWKRMREDLTDRNRLQGKLPTGTEIVAKTGASDLNWCLGIIAAVNGIGIVFLPNGSYFIISVFITESKENYTINEKIIADIALAAWEFFTREKRRM